MRPRALTLALALVACGGSPAAPPDGGATSGETRLEVSITTDCGAFSGTLVAPLCGVAA